MSNIVEASVGALQLGADQRAIGALRDLVASFRDDPWLPSSGSHAMHEQLIGLLVSLDSRLHLGEQDGGPVDRDRAELCRLGTEVIDLLLQCDAQQDLPDWVSILNEQLARSGALLWRRLADEEDESDVARIYSIDLLLRLAPLHDPAPEWILKALYADLALVLQASHASGRMCELVAEHRETWSTSLGKLILVESIDEGGDSEGDLNGRPIVDLHHGLKQMLLRRDFGYKPIIRTLHHLACTGGTVISKCLAVMPRVVLASEVNPLNRFSHQFEPSNPLLLLEKTHRPLTVGELREHFRMEIRQMLKICAKDFVDLVIRDHSHTDFCQGDRVSGLTPIRDFLEQDHTLLSVVTVRHPLDSYLGLLAEGWQRQFNPTDLEEYCRRYLAFVDRYQDLPVMRYEDFCENPQRFMATLCAHLRVDYSDDFINRFGSVELSGDSGRTSNDGIQLRSRREIPEWLAEEMRESISYDALLDRLGYA